MSGPINFMTKLIFGVSANKGMETCKKESISLFASAKESIMIVSGVLNHKFYNDQGIIDALNKAIENKVKIEIITGPEEEIDKESKKILDLYKQGKIIMLTLPGTPKLHFSVVDGRHVRLEDYHSGYEKESEAIIERRTIATADKQTREFIKLKNRTEPLHLDKVA